LVPYTGATGAVNLGNNNLIVDTSTLFVDATNDRVGIGTASPEQKLHMVGSRVLLTSPSAGATTLYAVTDNTSTVGQYILFGIDSNGGTTGYGSSGVFMSTGLNGAGTAKPLIIHNYDDKPIVFANANTERMRVDAGGNVGIGTTSPSSKLHVNGTLTVSSGSIQPATYTVATTPATAAAGMVTGGIILVSDAEAPTIGAAVASGAGTDHLVTCQYNGTNWIVTAILT
jgi:hypothetical protein